MRDRVAQPQLERAEAQRIGELVHGRLVREADLGRSEAAHRAAGRVVGVDDGAFDAHVRHLVGAGCERGRVRQHRRRRGRVGAAVEQQADVRRDERPVALRAVANPDP